MALPVHDKMWILYKNRIPVEKVQAALVIPRMNPLGLEYKRWWKIQKARCIDGYWVQHDGDYKWVSGPLYWFVNFWKIKLTPKGAKTKIKKTRTPFLRDLEWIKAALTSECKGFSGFEDDEEYTCHTIMEEVDPTVNPEEFEELLMEYNNPDLIRDAVTREDGTFKEFQPARDYLRKYFSRPMGKAMFYNMNYNMADMEARGGGKSYFAASTLAHNFIFDGALDYDEYLESKAAKEPMTSETLIGAIDSKYSNDVISKMKLGLNNLPGEIKIGDDVYPSPFAKRYSGSWETGKTITAGYDIKVGGQWGRKGSASLIQHRSFNDNHVAANGTRPNWSVIDEVGFMVNLIEVLGQMKEAAADGTVKQGTIWMTGTGGDMTGGATEAVKQVFYSPAAFDCLQFDDEFEGYQTKIGFFVPAWMTLNQFKDELGNTNWKAAIKYIHKTRERLKKNVKKKQAYEDEIVQRPLVHSEVFLLTNNSILPTADLKEHKDSLLAMGSDPSIVGLAGWMGLDDEYNPVFKLDPENYKPTTYPVKAADDNHGAVVIWEKPEEAAEYGWYVAGNDPYDFDIAPNSVSLGSVIIIRRATPLNGGFDRIVAEYTGRPGLASEFYEQVRRMLRWYGNASCLYENEKQHIKEHFKKMYSMDLLAYTPGVLKANETSKTAKTRVYGQHMSTPVKNECEIYLREWLLSPIGDGKLQLHTIKSIPLLDELISYNVDGNFDRVIALMLAIIQLIQMRNIIIEAAKPKSEEEEEGDIRKDFFNRPLFATNMRHQRN
jgi:hypothetical protein